MTALDDVLASAAPRSLARDCRVFNQGETRVRAHVLVDGWIRISQSGSDGGQVVLRFIGPGDIFGAVSLFTDRRYPADADTLTDATEVSWSDKALLELMSSHPQIAINAIRIVGQRLQEAQHRVRELATQSAERRVAHALLRLTRQVGTATARGIVIRFPLRRKDIADIGGTTLYSASRILSAWERAGWLKTLDRRIAVESLPELARIADEESETEGGVIAASAEPLPAFPWMRGQPSCRIDRTGGTMPHYGISSWVVCPDQAPGHTSLESALWLARGAERGDQPGRVILEHLGVFLPALRRPQRHSRFHRHDMHMQVKHHLSADGFAELLDDDAFGVEGLHGGERDRLAGSGDFRQIIRRNVEDSAGRGLRKHQRVSGRARHDVEKREGMRILVNLEAPQFAAQDLRKNVLVVVGWHHSLYSVFEERKCSSPA